MTELKPCPFCGGELTAPTPVRYPKKGLARLHPGSVDDGSCPIAGWGFYDEQLERWNTRAAEEGKAELVEALERIEGATMSMYFKPADMVQDIKRMAAAALARVRGEG